MRYGPGHAGDLSRSSGAEVRVSSTAKEDPLEGQVVDSRYRLRRRIGSGGMSVVYLAERVGIGKPIAIKFLRSAFANLPDFVRRFEQEAHACSRLSHLNCVTVIDFGVAFGSPYLVMEYVHGRLLSSIVAAGPVTSERAITITRQILAGLRHAHARSVIHRDLKPGNVMLMEMTGAADFVKIMDFGTAQILTGEGAPQKAGTDVGTPWYMSPEQAAGQPTDQRTDLYAVGVMLFEMLTGERPYVAEDPMRVLQMHLFSPIPSARALKPELGLSPELEAAIVKAMQKQPGDRFDSAEAFDRVLQDLPELRRVRGSAVPRTGELPAIPAVTTGPLPAASRATTPSPLPPSVPPAPSTPARTASETGPAPAMTAPEPDATPPPALVSTAPTTPSSRHGWIVVAVVIAVLAGATVVLALFASGALTR
jgi:serine/threonine-protein kinase